MRPNWGEIWIINRINLFFGEFLVRCARPPKGIPKGPKKKKKKKITIDNDNIKRQNFRCFTARCGISCLAYCTNNTKSYKPSFRCRQKWWFKLKKVKFSLFIYYIYCSSSSLLLPFNQVLYLANHSWFSKHLPVSCCFDLCNCALCATIRMSTTLRAFSVTIYQFVFTSWQIFADQMTFRTMNIIF